ncbi:nickel pincer cofactor biosynthesis protein LarB [Myxococcota bacterium]|nr:nickel pincer cofactor biosynthesis protein LarB [Myxococcota bacterium]
MDSHDLKDLLEAVATGTLKPDDALDELGTMPFLKMGDIVSDSHRALRRGLPEAIYGGHKTVRQICDAIDAAVSSSTNCVVTRVCADKARDVLARLQPMADDGRLEWHEPASLMRILSHPIRQCGRGTVIVMTAGASDIPVAEEAALTLELSGDTVMRIKDVGVAGIHRLSPHLAAIRNASVIIVAAGMEGALPGIVAGLGPAPVIGVPTSVGYGTAFGGLTALLAMLNSCSGGVTVVNIDNGYGAAAAAHLINARREFEE